MYNNKDLENYYNANYNYLLKLNRNNRRCNFQRSVIIKHRFNHDFEWDNIVIT